MSSFFYNSLHFFLNYHHLFLQTSCVLVVQNMCNRLQKIYILSEVAKV